MVKFKDFECFSSAFQGKFYFQGLYKTVLYIQVLFKPVRTSSCYHTDTSLYCPELGYLVRISWISYLGTVYTDISVITYIFFNPAMVY